MSRITLQRDATYIKSLLAGGKSLSGSGFRFNVQGFRVHGVLFNVQDSAEP